MAFAQHARVPAAAPHPPAGLLRSGFSGRSGLLFDEPTVTSYKWYDFDDASALKKVLVKTRDDLSEPQDIVDISPIVRALQNDERIYRVYAEDTDKLDELNEILKEAQQ